MREQIAPGSSFTLITQNVDGLSPRAAHLVAEKHPELAEEARSDAVQNSLLEMHGRLFEVLCSNEMCGHTELNLNYPVCLALSGTEEVFTRDAPEPVIDLKALPRCSKCGSLARPGVVWFGEQPWHMDTIDELVEKADLCIVVGTSSTASVCCIM